MEIDTSNVNFFPSDYEVEQKKKKKSEEETTKVENKELNSEDIQKVLKRVKKNSTKLINDIESLYKDYPDKNVYDAIAYLESVKTLLNNVN